MNIGMRRRTLALAVAGVIALGGCTSTFTAQPYTPGVGANVDAGAMKLRSLVIIKDGDNAYLTGALVGQGSGDRLVALRGTTLDASGNPTGGLTFSGGQLEAPADRLVPLEFPTDGSGLTAGLNVLVEAEFEQHGTTRVVVPVVTKDNPDYATFSPTPQR